MAEQEPESGKTRNLADFLWPLGGTFFGLFVIRIAMAQYQTFFNQNEWLRIIKGRPFEVGFECQPELYRKEHPL